MTPPSPGGLLAGAAVEVVDVPVGTALAGFVARPGPSTGVHDPLTVRAAVVGDVAVVTADVCALHEDSCARVRDLLRPIGVRDAVVTATHTHSGPCVARGRVGEHDAQVHDRVVAAAVTAVGRAWRARVPVTLAFGEATGVGVARDRRHPERAIDPPVQLLRATAAGDAVSVVLSLVVYPCHPVVLDGANTLVSGDYPGYVRDLVERAAPGSVCLFATGAAGDVNTGHSAEASFTPTGTGRRTFAEAERIGTVLAEAVARVPLRALDDGGVAVRTAAVTLPMDAPGDPAWSGRVTVTSLGELRVVGLPGEPFLASAERLRALRPGRPTVVLGYADGVPGYLPVAEEYAHGGYEVLDAYRYYGMPGPFRAGGAEILHDAAAALLRDADGG
ncbi:neutral/alkaline non-lysosomal ceramidase N-terminal domain-containing protein [Georgenia satyanarayanai]|uniref:neutral/alkaline non-lysosomal ceramidase N-terminal domain-containing protein n=1 Tax=Georgenia satyanarayanai TaxID=860221 RepID=UPI00126427EB|nr:neutral/alkaline non-lysosomal ceramidase N-terminal domain-containing protein [Georgenia satyanarayanai]